MSVLKNEERDDRLKDALKWMELIYKRFSYKIGRELEIGS